MLTLMPTQTLRRALHQLSLAAACSVLSGAAFAQTYPNKPVRLMVPFPPGGSVDIVSRIVALKLSERLGQQVVIENRGGGGGVVGTAVVAKAAPDGYTLVMGSNSTHVVAPLVHRKLDYDPVKDFAPVSLVASTPYLLVINPNVKANNLKELLELFRAQPGKLNYASAGTGSTTQLAMEMLKSAAKVFVLHIPYKGNGPAGVAAMSGEVEVLFGSLPAVLPHALSGKVRPIAVGSLTRSPSLPNVPTVAESGFPGFDASLWLAIMAPGGTPAPIVERLNKEIGAVLAATDTAAALAKAGAAPQSSTPAQLAAMIRDETPKYAKIVKDANIQPE